MNFDPGNCLMQGRVVDRDVIGALNEASSDSSEWSSQLEADGYLLIRSAIDQDDVLKARSAVFKRLASVDEIAEPAADGIATGRSQRKELHADLGAFWRETSQLSELRKVSHGRQINSHMDKVFGEPASPHDYMFLRPAVPSRATDLHYDYPFFARGSQRVHTVWTALGDIPVCDGPLVVVEGSHHFGDLISPTLEIDYDSITSPQVQLTEDPVEFAKQRATRLLTTHFEIGDAIIFTMTALHGTLDNHSKIGRTRLSCDVRWQPSADRFDERYMGDDPPGTTGVGYGELNGAKPLTEAWHRR